MAVARKRKKPAPRRAAAGGMDIDPGGIERVSVTWCDRDGMRYQADIDLHQTPGFWWNKLALAPGGGEAKRKVPMARGSAMELGRCSGQPLAAVRSLGAAAASGPVRMGMHGPAQRTCWFEPQTNQWICPDGLF